MHEDWRQWWQHMRLAPKQPASASDLKLQTALPEINLTRHHVITPPTAIIEAKPGE